MRWWSARALRTARNPHTNSTRVVLRTRSVPRMSRAPISAVERTCVPPQALLSSVSMLTTRSSPSRGGALRRPVTVAELS